MGSPYCPWSMMLYGHVSFQCEVLLRMNPSSDSSPLGLQQYTVNFYVCFNCILSKQAVLVICEQGWVRGRNSVALL